ncbi:MAG: hypothetical protein AAFQ40_05935 [Cyanobacteria bacterium J06623_5]
MVASNIDISNTANTAPPSLDDLVHRASRQEIITLHTQDDKSAVLLSLEAFEYLVGLQKYHQQALMPSADFEKQFHQSLVNAGYDSREKIIDLVQDVKRELYEERLQQQ